MQTNHIFVQQIFIEFILGSRYIFTEDTSVNRTVQRGQTRQLEVVMGAIRNTKSGCGENVSECHRVTECVRREGGRREGQREPEMKSENDDLWIHCI